MVFAVNSTLTNEAYGECSAWDAPPRFGGAADALVSVEEVDKWRRYRSLRESERRSEALSPRRARARYRLEIDQVVEGCVNINALIDLGRNIFLRRFSRAEGYGHGIKGLASRSRFQRGHFGGPDASTCVDCHWKGGFAGAGDRVDNTYAFGDGEHLSSADPRNPPPLWGLGWVELLADEMSEELLEIRDRVIKRASLEGAPIRAELTTKGVEFGAITAHPDGRIDHQELEGVDADLVIKPFGWRGVFSSLREFVEVSAHKHLGLQSERLVAAPYREVELGDHFTDQLSSSQSGAPHLAPPSDPLDPDRDGIKRELTEGQILALVSFIATLDTPQVEVPTRGVYQLPPRTGELEFIDTPAFTDRWLKGALLFEEVGCAGCHRPYLPLKRSVLKIPLYEKTGRDPLAAMSYFTIDLSAHAAAPLPERKRSGESAGEVWLVPAFSDFKRHKMGEHLRAQHTERGVSADEYLTRRLWGLRKTSPYLHHGGALSIEEAIRAHGGEGSEALSAAERFEELDPNEQSSLRLFLMSLSRGPAIRIR